MLTTRPTALITGASAGIGAAFARVLAENHHDTVLVARRRERLEALAESIRSRYEVEAHVVPADLSRAEAPDEIASWVESTGVHVDVLVNNAGYGIRKGFLEATWQEHDEFLRVMLTSYVRLAHRFLPAMKARREGRIINVASLAAFMPPLPGSLYGPCKSFLVQLSRSLDRECAPHGVRVTALCPGFTYTEFHDVLGNREEVNRLPGFMWMDAETVARRGYRAARRGQTVHVTGGLNRCLATLARALPMNLSTRFLRVTPYWNIIRRRRT